MAAVLECHERPGCAQFVVAPLLCAAAWPLCLNAMSGLAAPISAYSSVRRWAQPVELQINILVIVAAPLPQASKPPDAVSLVRAQQLERCA
ncbi:MAG: hypothetical protein ACYCZF_07890 [Anaerolineae bacterium]